MDMTFSAGVPANVSCMEHGHCTPAAAEFSAPAKLHTWQQMWWNLLFFRCNLFCGLQHPDSYHIMMLSAALVQDNLDNGKPISPTKVVPAEQFQFAQRTSESDINPAAAAATDAASWPFDDGSRSKSVKTPGSAGKIARTNSTPGKRAPWGSRGAAAAQITPEKTQSAKYTPNTSSGGLSPSVFRPTCSSNARAQAVSVNKAANSASGTWKF